MTAECNQFVLGFHPLKRREIRAQFDGGAISSDGGGLLLRGGEKRIGVFHRLSECGSDRAHGAGVGGPESLWSRSGLRRFERSRGVAERSAAGGVGGEAGSQSRSFGGE